MQYYISGKTQTECLRNLKYKIEEIEAQPKKPRNKRVITFIDWYNQWLGLFKQDIKETTLQDYNKHLRKLSEEFKYKDITKITAIEVVELLNNETKTRARQKLYEFLKPIFTKAKAYKILYENIFDVIEKPKHTKENGIALTQAQQEEFERLCDLSSYGNMYRFILYQGLRIGEALGLTYKDIDTDNNKITINKQLTPFGVVSYTKNQQSTRVIPLFKKSRTLFDWNGEANERIFNINYRQANYYLHKLTAKSKLPNISIHDLRHTFITNCKIKNIPEHIIQAIVGHEIGSKVTKQVYTHFNLDDNMLYLSKLDD